MQWLCHEVGYSNWHGFCDLNDCKVDLIFLGLFFKSTLAAVKELK